MDFNWDSPWLQLLEYSRFYLLAVNTPCYSLGSLFGKDILLKIIFIYSK